MPDAAGDEGGVLPRGVVGSRRVGAARCSVGEGIFGRTLLSAGGMGGGGGVLGTTLEVTVGGGNGVAACCCCWGDGAYDGGSDTESSCSGDKETEEAAFGGDDTMDDEEEWGLDGERADDFRRARAGFKRQTGRKKAESIDACTNIWET